MNFFKIFSTFFFFTFFFSLMLYFLTPVLAAQNSLKNEFQKSLIETRQIAGYPGGEKVEATRLPKMVGQIISIAISFVGLVFLILLIYGGFLWMTAGGNEEQVTKAKKILKNSTIGLSVVLAAYTITYFIVSQLIE